MDPYINILLIIGTLVILYIIVLGVLILFIAFMSGFQFINTTRTKCEDSDYDDK